MKNLLHKYFGTYDPLWEVENEQEELKERIVVSALEAEINQ